ncbi:S1C family serine protease [Anaerofustis stercorihominis]|uniref:PDZ domain-containing protein n=1 Tax=Anaerofustis stercorihominis TaxID=214853 RepID=A0A3E3DZC1_9FIRM|nr:trypsin-like peptidase domain-containing protein [Anaerofustis stercorihominis]MCQ4794063.1 trypsin-like peptidase domain-containing protein [Anaerofustis stercorihominis]RGD74634.1 PDZ domain-containing protein [Anaerofustis stercorihominis]
MDNNIDNVNKSYKKRRTAIFALIVAAMMITSTVLGFVGGFAANKFLGSNKADGVTSTSIPVASTTSSESGNMNVSNVVKSVKNSVVSIECESQSQAQINPLYDSGSSTSKSAGSGVIVTTDGYIVTNNHVVDGADKITVKTADEKSYTAKLVGVDSETDIAVIKIEAKGLKSATFGKSSTLEVGDEIVAIGNPLGELSGTVTNGIVSALSREVTIENETMNLIQTNASINAGNSGGGLFDKNGLLVGVVNAKAAGNNVEGIGFAIPIDTAKNVIEQIIDYGYVKGRVTSGLTLIDILDENTARQYSVNELGVYIYSVAEGSNAEKAGLKSGYIVKSVNGTKVESASDFKAVIKKLKVGDKIKVTVSNGMSEGSVEYKLSEKK